jgi:t-SNARE complex subunit (syntaxin)
MITIDLNTLHTLLVLAREATQARESRGDLAPVPDVEECHRAIEEGATAIERAFSTSRNARSERARCA